MDDTPEVIRQQMEETKTQLSEKLESLEHQVTETVQSTGTAVNATVGAVQETVETVTGAIQGAVQSVNHAFDLQRQIHQHPWLVIGGSVVLGYVAAELLTGSTKTPQPRRNSADNRNLRSEDAAAESVVTATAIAAAHESGLKSSSWRQLRDVAFGAVISMVQEIATRAVPPVVDYLTGRRSGSDMEEPRHFSEQHNSPGQQEPFEAARSRSFAAPEQVRAGTSF